MGGGQMVMSKRSLVSYPVWDRPTRWFHWINLICVAALAAVGIAILYKQELGVIRNGKILLITTHVWLGYLFAVNLAWRIIWAFIGNKQAKWSAILPFQTGYGAAFKTYLREFIQGDVRPYLGHNPIARLSISILLVLLVLEATTGLVLAGSAIDYPPFGHWIAARIAANRSFEHTFLAPLWTIHRWNFYAIVIVSAFHVAGVVLTELREGGGNKVFDQQPRDDISGRK
jgi:Ni/Fe-hydrogenase 1 B-type cytochrome subunit